MFVLLEDRFREGGRCAGALVASAKRIAPQHLGSARARPSRSSAMPEVPPASPLWQGVPVHHPWLACASSTSMVGVRAGEVRRGVRPS